MDAEEKIIKIALHYGYAVQSRQFMEECAEAIQATNKLWRKFPQLNDASYCEIVGSKEYKGIVEEMADVLVMIGQMEFLLGCRVDLRRAVNRKLDRQIERIDNNE